MHLIILKGKTYFLEMEAHCPSGYCQPSFNDQGHQPKECGEYGEMGRTSRLDES